MDGPRTGSQKVSTYIDRGSCPRDSITGSLQGMIVIVPGKAPPLDRSVDPSGREVAVRDDPPVRIGVSVMAAFRALADLSRSNVGDRPRFHLTRERAGELSGFHRNRLEGFSRAKPQLRREEIFLGLFLKETRRDADNETGGVCSQENRGTRDPKRNHPSPGVGSMRSRASVGGYRSQPPTGPSGTHHPSREAPSKVNAKEDRFCPARRGAPPRRTDARRGPREPS